MATQIPATSLAGLEKFAGACFEGAQGKYVLDEFAYFDDTSLFSTVALTDTAGVIPAGQEYSLFTAPVGTNGQGFPAGINLTLADTNLPKGWEGGKPPANQAYVALAGGFEVYYCSSKTAAGQYYMINQAADLHQILSNVTWSWNVGGDASPRIRYEPIKLWPCGCGVAGVSTTSALDTAVAIRNDAGAQGLSNGGVMASMRKFAFPLFFPPNVAVDCRLTVQKAINIGSTLVAAGQVRIAFNLRGYKLSRIV